MENIIVIGNTMFTLSDNYISILSEHKGTEIEAKREQANKVLKKYQEDGMFNLSSYAPLITPGRLLLTVGGTYKNTSDAERLAVDIAAVFS